MIIVKNIEKRVFKWISQSVMVGNEGEPVSSSMGESHVCMQKELISEVVFHFSLKQDQMEHVWSSISSGNS